MEKVAVVGAGAFGTAMAVVLARNGLTVNLWCHEAQSVSHIIHDRINVRYLPGVHVDSSITPSADMEFVLEGVELIFEAIPVVYLREVCTVMAPLINDRHVMVALSKGIEERTLLLPTEIFYDVFVNHYKSAVISGPSFAADIAQGQMAGVALAARDKLIGTRIAQVFEGSSLRLNFTQDVKGVQLVGALKNVVALGVGILEGVGVSDSAKIFFFMRAVDEIKQCVSILGGQEETVYGLAGLGDLMLTACGPQSRNRRLGHYRGQGLSMAQACQKIGSVPEGINTCKSLQIIAERNNIVLPVLTGIGKALTGTVSCHELVYAGL